MNENELKKAAFDFLQNNACVGRVAAFIEGAKYQEKQSESTYIDTDVDKTKIKKIVIEVEFKEDGSVIHGMNSEVSPMNTISILQMSMHRLIEQTLQEVKP